MPVQLLSSIKGSLGNDAGYTRTAENEIAIVNFRDDKTGWTSPDLVDTKNGRV